MPEPMALESAIAALRDAPKILAALIEGAPEEVLCRKPAPGKWSVRAILAHLAEDELTSSWRYRQMIEHDGVTRRTPRSGDRPLMRLTLDLGPDAMGGPEAGIAISPDGRRIAFPIRRPDGTAQLATRLLEQTQPAVLPGTEGAHQPFFSPDGQWIGYLSRGE